MNEPTVEQPGARPEAEQVAQKIKAYARRHWRGENTLAQAFWINHIVGMILVEIIYVLLLWLFLELAVFAFAPRAMLRIAVLGFYVWSIVGTWRTTSVSIRKARPVRIPFWSYVVRVWLIVLVFWLTLDSLGLP